MKTIALTLSMLALLACGPSCASTPQVIVRQEPALVACLPTAIPRLLACHASPLGESTCIILEVTSLVACWAGHQPPTTPAPAPGSGSAVGSLAARPLLHLAALPGIGVHLSSVTIRLDGIGDTTVSIDADVAGGPDVPPELTDAVETAWSRLFDRPM